MTVQRIRSAFAVAPHRQRYFKLPTDPYCAEKVRDVVGLYLNLPDKALVLCVDEKSQVQALDRIQPMLPLGWVTWKAWRTATSATAPQRCLRHWISPPARSWHDVSIGIDTRSLCVFSRYIEAQVPADLEVHLVLDNYATHRHPKVRTWLAQRPRPAFSCISRRLAPRLNQVERWSAHITERAVRLVRLGRFHPAQNRTTM